MRRRSRGSRRLRLIGLLLLAGATANACASRVRGTHEGEWPVATLDSGLRGERGESGPTSATPDLSLPPLTASADVPSSPRLRVRRLAAPPDAGCGLPFTPSTIGSCRTIATRAHASTGDSRQASAAFDHDPCSIWNAGARPPQAIRAVLGGDRIAFVSAIVFVPEMTPNGSAQYVLELTGDHGVDERVVVAPLESAATYVVAFDRPVPARVLTVRSATGSSWVAFREIAALECDGAPALESFLEVTMPAPRPPDPPQPVERFTDGKGTCRVDADCVPAECCHARACSSKSAAPSCDGVGCSQNVVPGTIDMGRCACLRSRCGLVVRERALSP